MGYRYQLTRQQFVPRPLSEVFAFFDRPENLEKLTPAFLRFQIVTPPPIAMRQGARIDYKIKLYGIPMKWRTLISLYEPPYRFVDQQEKGPYAYWNHLHEFREVSGGTEISDTVDYELPMGPLGRMAHGMMVQFSLRRIFDHRVQVVEDMWGGPDPDSDLDPGPA